MVPSAVVRARRVPAERERQTGPQGTARTDFGSAAVGFVAPRTPIEQIVAAVFADVLGLPGSASHDNFFDLGGNSLIATRVVARINAAIGDRIGLRDVFDAPTVAGLAARAEPQEGRNRVRR